MAQWMRLASKRLFVAILLKLTANSVPLAARYSMFVFVRKVSRR